MDALWQDVRYSIRQWMKAPGLAALAIVSLALGIGANTAMFTVVESVLLRPLPYADAGRLVSVGLDGSNGGETAVSSTSWLNYRDIREQAHSLSAAAGYSEDIGVVQGREGSLSVATPRVTPNLFPLLGTRPQLGRTFSEAEGQAGGPRVAILSEALWRQSFGADPRILGRTVRVNAEPRTVIGVMPASFRFPETSGDLTNGLWMPIQPTAEMLKERGYNFFFVVGQLAPGSTLARLRGELAAIAGRIRHADPQSSHDLSFAVLGYQELLTGNVRPVLLGLLAALGLVLLIACANVANLLIARCLGRRQEFAVRAALGAGQARLMRQLLLEGALLSLGGCVLGLGLAEMAIAVIHKLPPDTIPRGEDIAVRWTVVLTLALIASITTVLSASLPAFLAGRTDPQPALQSASRGTGARSVRSRLTGWVVAGEVALSVVLLVSAGLLFRTLWNLEHARLGIEVTRVTSFSAMPADAVGFGNMAVTDAAGPSGPHIATLVYQPVLDRMRSLPGFQDAALVTAPPLSGVDLNSSFTIVGIPEDRQRGNSAKVSAVSGSYARVLGTPVVRGRMIGEADAANTPFVVAVNETFARKYFPNQDLLGKQVSLGGKDTGMIQPYTIVGVIGDQVDRSAAAPVKPLILLPYRQIPSSSIFYAALLKTIVFFVVKTRAEIPVTSAARSVFREVAPDFALDNFETMSETLAKSTFSERLGLYLISIFGGMAVLMVIGGLYGVLTQMVSYRRREIGIRLALGATPPGILSMVLRQASGLVIAGIAAGTALAVGTGKLEEGFLYGVKPLDAWTYAMVIAVLMIVGGIAAFVPARRAAAIEPADSLRDE
jgi:putative ABC transport system permease protein